MVGAQRQSAGSVRDIATEINQPLADLHVHVEGAIPLNEMIVLWLRNGLTPPSHHERPLANLLACADFDGFLRAWSLATDCLRTGRDLASAVTLCAIDASRHGAIYLEAIFSPARHLRLGLTLDQIFDAFCTGREIAESVANVHVRLTPDIPRGVGADLADAIARTAVTHAHRGVVGLGVGGDERIGSLLTYRTAVHRAQAAGLAFVPHAGEFTIRAIREALSLGATRIRHGLVAATCRESLDMIASRGVVLDICPTSNITTGALNAVGHTAFRQLVNAGVQCSIGTDDPTIFRTDLRREYLLSSQLGGPTHQSAFAAAAAGAACSSSLKDQIFYSVAADAVPRAEEIRQPPNAPNAELQRDLATKSTSIDGRP